MIGLLLALMPDAHAVSQKFCFGIDADYDELVPYGTWWTTKAERPLYGVEAKVSGGPQPWWSATANTAASGANAGCFTIQLYAGFKYDVVLYPRSKVFGRETFVVPNETDPRTAAVGLVVLTDFIPTGAVEDVLIAHDSKFGPLNVASWMFSRSSFGLSSTHSLRIVTPGKDPGSAAGPTYARINSDDKRRISHEIGHWVGQRLDEIETSKFAPPLMDLDCQGGGNDDLTKEYDSTAATEGWADYVAAWTWNSSNYNKCALQKRGTSFDFDLDGDGDAHMDLNAGIMESGQWGCEGALEDFNSDGDLSDPGEVLWTGWTNSNNTDTPNPWPTSSDWLQHMVTSPDSAGDGLECNGTLAGRSSKADWTRFFWDFCRDYGRTMAQCNGVFDAADPWTWDRFPDGAGYRNDDPICRLKYAAIAAGYGTEFSWEKHNGLDHYSCP